MSSTILSDAASSFRIGLSTFINASLTSLRQIRVAFVSTEISESGKYLSLSSSVISIISGKCGFNVGSPSPENVIESMPVPADLHSESFASSSLLSSSGRGSLESPRPSLFHPHSQYTQSKLQILPFSGRRLIPNDEPSLLLKIGPNTSFSRSMIDI